MKFFLEVCISVFLFLFFFPRQGFYVTLEPDLELTEIYLSQPPKHLLFLQRTHVQFLVPTWQLFLFVSFETASHVFQVDFKLNCVAENDLKLTLLPPLPKYWNYKHMPPCLAPKHHFLAKQNSHFLHSLLVICL